MFTSWWQSHAKRVSTRCWEKDINGKNCGDKSNFIKVTAEELRGAFGSCKRLKYLLDDCHADPLMEYNGKAVVLVAAEEGCLNAFDMLFLRLKSPGSVVDSSGNNLAHYVAMYNFSGPMLRKLSHKGVGLARKNSDGKTPLHYALQNMNESAVRVLLEIDSKALYERDKNQVSPFDIYVKYEGEVPIGITESINEVLTQATKDHISDHECKYSNISTSNSFGSLEEINLGGDLSLSFTKVTDIIGSSEEINSLSPQTSVGDGEYYYSLTST